MIGVKCINCKKELEEPGAILISPPLDREEDNECSTMTVDELHLCKDCYYLTLQLLSKNKKQ